MYVRATFTFLTLSSTLQCSIEADKSTVDNQHVSQVSTSKETQSKSSLSIKQDFI